MRAAPALLLLAATLAPTGARAESCDALAARVIRVTGASLAGRAEPGAVFRAADAERMSLDCRAPRRIVLGALDREPIPRFFALVGLAAQALAGTEPGRAEALALRLHQDSLLAGAPMQGRDGRLSLRCETGPRGDSLAGLLTICVVEMDRGAILHRKAHLPRSAQAG
ncbi:hypothetical protein [Methylobacterium dankookense]|uniref:Uncharacterized protein n=1 Tax=Methylobacterium dankookense TaxID=560405 RepID=A0A564G0W8_9HYPH|nr:hypothetical protein [Methylobacterium dankookense]GJD55408.1 hypothetical protein IFDJLNFL_1293 [Methylobacterium dankookense]VUF13590.1 hypothetical protein MTDSW087_03297 [Methylobacterium dankookense]